MELPEPRDCFECAGIADFEVGDHGHVQVRCRNCGHIGGPFVSRHLFPEVFEEVEAANEREEGQAGLGDFA